MAYKRQTKEEKERMRRRRRRQLLGGVLCILLGIGMLRLTAACTALQIVWRIIFSYLFGFQFGLPAICLATGTGWVVMVIVEGVYVKRYFDSHREMA